MKRLMLLIFTVCLLMSQTCFAGLNDYPDIAVLNFTNKVPHLNTATSAFGQISLEDASVASDRVMESLLDSGRFNLIERDQLEAILNEHALNLSGTVDPATAVQIGRLTGVQYIVYGSVVNCSLKASGVSYDNTQYGGLENNQYTVIADVTARFIDVETGRIALIARGHGESTSTSNEIQWHQYKDGRYGKYYSGTQTIKFGVKEVSQTQVYNAIGKAADDLVFGKMGFLAKLDGKAKRRY